YGQPPHPSTHRARSENAPPSRGYRRLRDRLYPLLGRLLPSRRFSRSGGFAALVDFRGPSCPPPGPTVGLSHGLSSRCSTFLDVDRVASGATSRAALSPIAPWPGRRCSGLGGRCDSLCDP